MSEFYRGYEVIEEKVGKRVFLYEAGSSGDAKPAYIADDWDDVEDFINANPATKQLAPLDAEPQDAEAELVSMSYNLESIAGELVSLKMNLAEGLGFHRHTFLDVDGNEAVVDAIAALRAQVAALTAERDALEGDKRLHDITYEHASKRRDECERALEPFAEAWSEIPLDLSNPLFVGQNTGINLHKLALTAKDLGNAHAVFFQMPPTPEKID